MKKEPPAPATCVEIAKGVTLARIREDQERAASDDVKALLEVIRERLYDPAFDVHELARLCSPRPETRWRFNDQLGLGLRAYIDSRRLETAFRLTREPGVRVSDIAAGLGFEDGEMFSKWFKRRTGLSPTKLQVSRGLLSAKRRELAAAVWRRALVGVLGEEDAAELVDSLRRMI